jgi:uncharacterized glyoxalase superfamily protein PhnB
VNIVSTTIHLDQVNIVVADMEAMAAFYARLGLEVDDGGPPAWRPHHREMATDGATVEIDSEPFAVMWNQGWPGGPGVVLGFRVPTREDVDRLYDELTAAGHAGQQQPYDAFWGARFAVVSDPDGNSVALMSHSDSAFRRPPPAPPERR